MDVQKSFVVKKLMNSVCDMMSYSKDRPESIGSESQVCYFS